MTAPRSFYEFLIAYVSPSSLGDPISDLGADVRHGATMEREEGVPACEAPPRTDAALYDHLKRHVPSNAEEVVDEAWLAYLKARSC